MTNRFSRADARRFYDRFGAKQDAQGFYEDAALEALIAHGEFSLARSVLEIGCGTGRLAARLLADHLTASATYVGVDISETMVGLARRRLEPWSARARVQVSDGDFDFAACGGPFDRVVATYVFDLLSHDDIARALAAARRATSNGGLLCACGLTRGTDILSKATSSLWALLHNAEAIPGRRLPPCRARRTHSRRSVADRASAGGGQRDRAVGGSRRRGDLK